MVEFSPSLYACCAGKLATTEYKTDGSSEPVNSSSSRLTARTRKGSLQAHKQILWKYLEPNGLFKVALRFTIIIIDI